MIASALESPAAAALQYAEFGWCVLPVRVREKRPHTRNGVHDASREPETIRRWWCRWSDASVGIATGAVSGIVVIDVDGPAGAESLAALEREHGALPDTVTSLTGGGGRHLFFRHPGGHVGNRTGLRPGLDLRGDGGYVVAPPSMHASGTSYAWVTERAPGDIEPAPMPDWLAALLQAGAPLKAKARQPTATQQRTAPQQHIACVQEGSQCYTSENPVMSGFGASSEADRLVEAAITATLPTRPGERNRRVFELARRLKGIPELAKLPGPDLLPIVREWHKRGWPRTSRTSTMAETLMDFRIAWERVEAPAGLASLNGVLARATAKAAHPAGDECDNPKLGLLARICEELAGVDGRFFLSCRMAGMLLGVSRGTAAGLLRVLRADGWLALVAEAMKGRRRANEYRLLRRG